MRFSEPRLPGLLGGRRGIREEKLSFNLWPSVYFNVFVVHLAEIISSGSETTMIERSRFIRKLKRRKEAFIPNNLYG